MNFIVESECAGKVFEKFFKTVEEARVFRDEKRADDTVSNVRLIAIKDGGFTEVE